MWCNAELLIARIAPHDMQDRGRVRLPLSPDQSHEGTKSQNPKVAFPDPPHRNSFSAAFPMRVRRARIQLTPDGAEEPMRGACVQPAADQRVESDDGG